MQLKEKADLVEPVIVHEEQTLSISMKDGDSWGELFFPCFGVFVVTGVGMVYFLSRHDQERKNFEASTQYLSIQKLEVSSQDINHYKTYLQKVKQLTRAEAFYASISSFEDNLFLFDVVVTE